MLYSKIQKNYLPYALLLLSFILILAIFLIVDGYKSYHLEFKKAREESESLTLVLAQYTQKTFEKMDIVCNHAIYVFEKEAPFTKSSFKENSEILYTINSLMPEAEIFALFDKDGHVRGSSILTAEEELHFGKANMTDREYFKEHKKNPDDILFISKPIISRSTGNLILSFTKKLARKDNQFNGVIASAINVELFSELFSKTKKGQEKDNTIIALLNMDKILLARFPYKKDLIGIKLKGIVQLDEKINNGEFEGTYKAKSVLDNFERNFTYKYIPEFKMILIVGKTDHDILKEWWRKEIITVSIFLLMMFFSIVGLILFLKRLQNIESEQNLAFQSSKMAAIGEMASGIAHEINNPLMIISSYNRVIKKNLDSEPINREQILKYSEKIDLTITRITNIITSMKRVSRDSSNEEYRPVSIAEVFEDVLPLCSEKFLTAGVEIKIDIESKVFNSQVLCNKVQLSQVILNLMNNAYDAVEFANEKWLEITCEKNHNTLIISIIDSGKGIPTNIQDKIFQPFFSTKDPGRGTGLGLSISRTIITRHKGKIYLDPNYRHTRFVIELPSFNEPS